MECGLALGIASSGGASTLSAAWATVAAASGGTAGTAAAASVAVAGAGGIGAICLGVAIGVGSVAIGVAVPLHTLMQSAWPAAPPPQRVLKKPRPKIAQSVQKLRRLKSKLQVSGTHVKHRPKICRRTTSQKSGSATLPVPLPAASTAKGPPLHVAKFLQRVGPSKPLTGQPCGMPSIAQAAAGQSGGASRATSSHTPSLDSVLASASSWPVLGQGRFGRVYLARLAGGQQCAVKVVASTPAAKGEVQCMLALGRHPGLVQLVHHFIGDLEVHLILEYCDCGSLSGKALAGNTLRSVTKQLVTALHYIHSCDYIHQDVKPDNVMLSSGGPWTWPWKLRTSVVRPGLAAVQWAPAPETSWRRSSCCFAKLLASKLICGAAEFCSTRLSPVLFQRPAQNWWRRGFPEPQHCCCQRSWKKGISFLTSWQSFWLRTVLSACRLAKHCATHMCQAPRECLRGRFVSPAGRQQQAGRSWKELHQQRRKSEFSAKKEVLIS